MIAMAAENDYVSVPEAAQIAGCTQQYIRAELARYRDRDEDGNPTGNTSRGGRVEGWLVNGKAWAVLKRSAVELGQTLSTRAISKRTKARKTHKRPAPQAKKPAAKRRKSR